MASVVLSVAFVVASVAFVVLSVALVVASVAFVVPVSYTHLTSVNNGMYNAAKANYMCYRTSKDAAYTNLLSFAEKKTTATDQFLGTVSHTLYHYKGVGTYWVNNWLCTDGAKTKYSGSVGADYTVSASDLSLIHISTQNLIHRL